MKKGKYGSQIVHDLYIGGPACVEKCSTGALSFNRAVKLIEALIEVKVKPSQVMMIGERIVNVERFFIVREEVRRRDDRLPKRFLHEPMPSGLFEDSIVELIRCSTSIMR